MKDSSNTADILSNPRVYNKHDHLRELLTRYRIIKYNVIHLDALSDKLHKMYKGKQKIFNFSLHL